jgi:glycosyltransferase involved in cell wall biosynthesis
MAVPLLLHVFPTFAVGGAQMRLVAIANRFGQRFRHAIIAMDGNVAAAEQLLPELAVQYPQPAIRKGHTLGNVRRFAALLRKLRPDVLVSYNWGSIEWAMANLLVGRPHLHIEDGFGPEERDRQLPRRVWIRRLFLRRATVALPSRTLERIAADIWRLPRRNLHYLPNGVDLSRFAPEANGELSPWPRDAPVVGTVAALRAEKNLSRLLHAFTVLRRTQPARLVIVGDGPERPALAALAAQLGIAADVVFTGHMAAPQRAYRHFDVFALSSDTEQMPLSVLEAMAAGLAVASTDVGDVAAMLAQENRPFVVAKDATALAGALLSVLCQPALRAAVGAANRARAVAQFDQERMFASYAALFDGLAATAA